MSLNVYYRRIDVIGKENVPQDGPIIFVANHPSALLDPITIAANVDREIHFLAGSNWFGKGFRARFLKNQLNMIPVHRPWLSKKKVSNEEMFEECYRGLDQNRCIILFPEASTQTVSKIRELKTGAVRIKAGFEEFTNGKKKVPLIPVGLSYSNPHEFQSRVVIKFGEAIEFDPIKDGADLGEVYRAQTDRVQRELKNSIIHIDNTNNESLVKNISRLFIGIYRTENDISFRDAQSNFEFGQNVAAAVSHFEKVDPQAYSDMSQRIQNYFNEIHELGISDDSLGDSNRSKPSIFKWLFMITGLTIALPSLIIFFIPYQLTKFIFLKKVDAAMIPDDQGENFDEAFKGTLIFAVGLLLFGLWTPIIGVIVLLITNWWIALLAMAAMYPMFQFSMIYAKVGLRMLSYYKGKRIRKRHHERVERCEKERSSIIEKLKEYQISYAHSD